MSDLDRAIFNYYAVELPAVQRTLERHFRVVPEFARESSWIRVLERGDDRGETAIDLLDRLERARFWVRTPAGEQAIADDPPALAVQLNRRPLALLLGPEGGGADFELELPARARFEAGVGLARIARSGDVLSHATPVTLRVSLADAADPDARYEPLATLRIEPGDLAATWRPFGVDLPGEAGRRVRLRLEGLDAPTAPVAVWWGSPRIVSRPSP